MHELGIRGRWEFEPARSNRHKREFARKGWRRGMPHRAFAGKHGGSTVEKQKTNKGKRTSRVNEPAGLQKQIGRTTGKEGGTLTAVETLNMVLQLGKKCSPGILEDPS